jgi:hypothetical protein
LKLFLLDRLFNGPVFAYVQWDKQTTC